MAQIEILVVEDEEVVALDIESTLTYLGYEVPAVVAYGKEAIELASEIQPDLVLMDIMLKGKMDGIDAAEEIRRRFGIPVVYLSANADVATLQRAKNSEPFGYVVKPFQEKELQITIEMALARNQAESRIKEALIKEKELSELKSQFIAIASHEFRTPLAVIQGSTELLERYCRPLDDKKSKHFQRIQSSVDDMIGLLDDVLLLGKVDAGKLEFKPAPLNLVEFCYNLMEPLELHDSSQHKIIFRAQGNCENACMDEYLLRHIFTNLLSNAIKYSPKGGEVNFQLDCDQQTVRFCVADEGIGIPKQDLSQLFESFYRATNVGNIQGTGLGLSIIKNCVDLHGGDIRVESTVGEGTTFTVTLPKRTDIPDKHQ